MARRNVTFGESRRNRREEIAAMEAGRKFFRTPGNLADLPALRPAQHQLEEPVIGPDITAPIGFDHQRRAGTAGGTHQDSWSPEWLEGWAGGRA